ncbi:MAG: hypothetical protein ACOZNI_17890 [Myxococcota bacterium]
MRSTFALAFLVLAGCPKPDEEGKDTNTGDIDGDDTGPAACVAELFSTDPEDGDAGVYFRGGVTVSLTDVPTEEPVIQVLDDAGAEVPASITWDESGLQAFVDVVLAPSSSFTLHVEVCGASSDVAFSTSDLGTPLEVPAADLVGRTYVFSLADAKITEPSFLDAVAGSYLTVPLLFGVEAASETEIDFVGALGELQDDGDYVQVDGQPTWDFPPADFTGTPYFEAHADEITIMYGEIAIPIEDFSLSGTFTSDGEQIAEGYATGFGDSRYMGGLVGRDGDPAAICEIASSAGVDCEDCSDGEPYCMYIVATEITAEYELGLTIEVVE